MRQEKRKEQEYMEYLQTLLVASYTMKPSLIRSMEDRLEEIATNQGQDKNQVRTDVKRILNLRKALMRFLKKITEERFQNAATDKNDLDYKRNDAGHTQHICEL